MDKYLHPEDCHIERCEDVLMGEVAELRDEEDACVLRVPATWTDEQIMRTLAFANSLYAKGIEAGKARKAAEIKACLQIV